MSRCRKSVRAVSGLRLIRQQPGPGRLFSEDRLKHLRGIPSAGEHQPGSAHHAEALRLHPIGWLELFLFSADIRMNHMNAERESWFSLVLGRTTERASQNSSFWSDEVRCCWRNDPRSLSANQRSPSALWGSITSVAWWRGVISAPFSQICSHLQATQ